MSRIKVIHPITRLIVGGAQQNTMETCAGLDRSRFAAEIIAGPDTGPEGELISEVRERGIPLTIMPELIRSPHPVQDYRAYRALATCFKQVRPHIVHTHSSKAGILGRWAARAAGVPIIVHTVHGWGHHDRQRAAVRRLYTFLERRAERFSDRLIVVSDVNRDKGLRDGIGSPDKYLTIHSSINLPEFTGPAVDTAALRRELGLDPAAPVVGMVGRLSPQKNPLDFVRVAERVRRQLPETQFLFIGDGPLRSRTEDLIRELQLEGAVVLAGLRRDVPQLLQVLDVFILTSLWEGLPRVIPQAMAAGLPVVANAVDGVLEVIQDGANGFTVMPGDLETMAARILALLKNPAERERIAAQGRLTARDGFSLDGMIARIAALYETLIAEKRVRV